MNDDKSAKPDIKGNYSKILAEINSTALACGRNPKDIKLIAVSKTKPIEYVKEAILGGAKDFGENRPQELKAKFDEINSHSDCDLRWHQIGHLQKNKVKYVVGRAALIHSLDSLELAAEIDKKAKQLEIVQDVLIQVNISGEESKFGISEEELGGFIERLKGFSNINLKGLMTISVKDYNREQNRELFGRLKELAEQYGVRELSMGMTNDFKEAIEAGATMIRVGTAIFGARDYGVQNQ